jgi:hypothetical protein
MSFSEYLQAKRGEGKELLRAKQFQSAMDGDRTMQIWLGKQYLNQSDKHETKTTDVTASPEERAAAAKAAEQQLQALMADPDKLSDGQ